MLDPKLIQREIKEAASEDARLTMLLDVSLRGYRSHPENSAKWAEQAAKLSRKLKRPLDEARATYRVGCAKAQLAQFDEARTYLTRAAEQFLLVAGGDKYIDAPKFMLAEIERKTGNLAAASVIYDEVLELRKALEKNNLWEVLVAKGIAALQSAEFAQALGSFYEALDSIEDRDDKLARSIILTDLGAVFLEIRDHERAQEYLNKALVLKREIGDAAGTASLLNNLAAAANERSDFELAANYAMETLSFAEDPACRPRIAFAKAILGEIALKQNRLAEAAEHFERSISLAGELELHALVADAQLGLAESLLYELPSGKSRKPKRAMDLTRSALQFSQTHGQKATHTRALQLLARAYQQSGDFEKASDYYAKYIALNGELQSQERQRQITEVQARVQIDKLEKERERFAALASSATERAALLEKEHERQTTELTTLALQLVQKNEFLAELRERIERDPASHNDARIVAESIVSQIDDHVRSDRDWEVFENQLSQVHGDFLKRLSAMYPALTPMELKTAALMKLNLSSKSIANLFCLSVRTVENHRLSIRRKIGLGPEDNLVSFLAGL